MPATTDSTLSPESRRAAANAFGEGLLVGLPLVPVVIPFGLVFGVIADEAGMSLAQVIGFSTLVLAGASQITAVQLLMEQAPMALILLSALAVNLRMAMYSASLVPWLGQASFWARAAVAYGLVDLTYAVAVSRYEQKPRWTLTERLAFFAGTALLLAAPWPAICALGATLGRAIPPGFGIDYAIPISFIAMTAPLLRSRAHVVAAVTGFGLALPLDRLPSGLGLLIAAIVAMAVGAAVEARTERRAEGG